MFGFGRMDVFLVFLVVKSGIMGFGEEDHTGKALFLSHYIKRMDYQQIIYEC